jgi:hypothetical protein
MNKFIRIEKTLKDWIGLSGRQVCEENNLFQLNETYLIFISFRARNGSIALKF